MKIYNKVVIDMASNKIVAEDSFEYFGEVAYCDSGGSTTVSAPQPTAEEIALQQMQLELLTQQQADAEMMQPYLLASMGYKEVDGELMRMTEDETYEYMTEVQRNQYDITKMSQERQKAAYAGELPVSPALEQSLGKQEQLLEEALSQRLGPDWQTTTSGQQAMSGLQQRSDLVREETRRGEISGGTGALLANLGQLQSQRALQASQASAYPGRSGGLFGMAGQAMQPYQNQRMMQYNAMMANAQMGASQSAGLMSGVGSLLGAGIGAYGLYKGLSY